VPDPQSADPTAWGVDAGYHDGQGGWREAPPSTVEAMLGAMGAEANERPAGEEDAPVRVMVAGRLRPVEGRWVLHTEDGESMEVDGGLPSDLAPGYHRLERAGDGRMVDLVVSPGSCWLPPDLRTWGWAVQLYAVRSSASWGMGDLGDLRELAGWAADRGAGALVVNPLHAALPIPSQHPSPYYPSSRCFRNPLYLRVEDVPGAEGSDLEEAVNAGRALNTRRLIDRDEVWRLKRTALDRLWNGFQGDPAFDGFCAERGSALSGYATFCALVEEHGLPWWEWPNGLRHPEGAGVEGFAKDNQERIRFHQWLQWLVDVQLREAGSEIGLVHDLAIGVDPAGADAWLWQDCMARDMRVGAPPDAFNSQGQDWGLPPFDPWRLRQARYEPFIRIIRAALGHGGGLRVDHVMGLFRLFWIPPDAGPTEGAYVRYPWQDLLGILALESQRAQAYVVGEDLGTVEDLVREQMAEHRMLSSRLLWFEPSPPSEYPTRSLAAVTTHDLPTIAGLWSGADLEEQEELHLEPNVEGTAELRQRLAGWTGMAPDASVDQVVAAVYRLLAGAPSAVVTATLDDALCVEERPNLPGTTDQRPNWSLALPRTLEQIKDDPLVNEVAEALDSRAPSS
jgi:4-alpha-glucanotransferase